jgi:hypothetical protein
MGNHTHPRSEPEAKASLGESRLRCRGGGSPPPRLNNPENKSHIAHWGFFNI